MKTVFVIMPSIRFNGSMQKLAILRRQSTVLGWQIHIPDYDHTAPSFDLPATRQLIQSSEIVFADLSFERPSSYFELGLAEAYEASVCLVAAANTPIHQATRRNAVSYFSSMSEFEALFRSALESPGG
jgi:hypothetical protein